MILTKHDLAQKQTGWRMREATPHRKSRDPSKRKPTLMDNPAYVEDLESSMLQREISEKWQVSQPVVSKHRLALREVEV
ncbi:hypothetical protein ACT3UJ_02245 [Halomonas sp. 86]|uniref:hypothetical protein n=1 Tax=unclassified Halomonas TaxID=2609666 RepID=UPI004033CCB8